MRIFKKIQRLSDVEIIVIIVTYNSKPFISKLLSSIRDQYYDPRKLLLVIIDNNSEDTTFQEVLNEIVSKEWFMNYVIVKLDKNVGFAPANNIGLIISSKLLGTLNGITVILLNPDTQIINKSFLSTAKYLTSYLPIVGFATISGSSNDVIDSLGAYVDALGNPQDLFYSVKISRSVKSLITLLPRVYAVPSVCFAAIAVRGDVFEAVGLLKNHYVIYFEDVEFCLRVWSMGVPVHVYRDFMVFHARGGTQRTLFRSDLIQKHFERTSLNILHHASKNSLVLSYKYLGPLMFLIRCLIYLIISFTFRWKYLVYSLLDALHIIKIKKLRWRRLPPGLVPRSPRTWVLLWTLKYLLNYGGGIDAAMGYGVRRASIEYVLRYLIPRYYSRRGNEQSC